MVFPGCHPVDAFSPGFHILLTWNLEVGLRVGWVLTAETAPFTSDAGFGWRW